MRRRELLSGVLVGAAAGPAVAVASGRARVLSPALEAAELAVFVTGNVLARRLLGPAGTAVARRILEHEQVHVRVLGPAVAAIGESAVPAPTTVAQADRRLAKLNASGRLAQLRTGDDALRLLYDVESIALGRCWEALFSLTEPSLINIAAGVMGANAQHASAIGGLLHPGKWERVVPVGSVEGKH